VMPESASPRTLLFVSPFLPAAGGNGAAMRAQALLLALAPHFSASHLLWISLEGEEADELDHETARLLTSSRFVPRPARAAKWRRTWQAWKFSGHWGSGSLAKEWRRLAIRWDRATAQACRDLNPDLLFIFRFQSLPAIDSLRRRSSRVWLDLDEVESSTQARRAVIEGAAPSAPLSKARLHSDAYQQMEKRELARFDRLFVSSPVEQKRVQALDPTLSPGLLPNVYLHDHCLPPKEPQKLKRLLFVGNFNHEPNVDVINYFCGQILPLLAPENLAFQIVGTGADKKWPSEAWPRVSIQGRVEDLTPFYREADLVIVPLRCGGGTRLKLLEAFSHQRAVLSTSIGAEGLDVLPGVHLRVADGVAAFAEACRDLLRDDEKRQRLAQAGHLFFQAQHTLRNLSSALAPCFSKF